MSENDLDPSIQIQNLISNSLNKALGPYIALGRNIFIKRDEIRAMFYLGKEGNDHIVKILFTDGSAGKITFIDGNTEKIKIN